MEILRPECPALGDGVVAVRTHYPPLGIEVMAGGVAAGALRDHTTQQPSSTKG